LASPNHGASTAPTSVALTLPVEEPPTASETDTAAFGLIEPELQFMQNHVRYDTSARLKTPGKRSHVRSAD
jgi:hypothetical protein